MKPQRSMRRSVRQARGMLSKEASAARMQKAVHLTVTQHIQRPLTNRVARLRLLEALGYQMRSRFLIYT